MARSVSGLFEHQAQVDSVVGALRDAGLETAQISIIDPDAPPPEEAADTLARVPGEHPRNRLSSWVATHLRHRGVADDHAERLGERVAGGRRLVNVAVTSDAQDDDARNLMVTAGAEEISSATDGKMIHIVRPGGPT